MKSLSFTLVTIACAGLMANCIRSAPPATAGGSQFASVSIGSVDTEVVDHDGMLLKVTKGTETTSYDTREGDDFSKINFTAGETVSLRLALFKGDFMKARTNQQGDPNCPPTELTLKPGANQALIKVCIAGSANVAQSDGQEANLDIKPCVAGVDCPEDQVNGCKENVDGKWASLGGGCQYLPSLLTFSSISNDKGTPIKFTEYAAAKQYCDNLEQGGKSDWRLAREADLRKVGDKMAADPLRSLQTLGIDRSYLNPWIESADGRVFSIPNTSLVRAELPSDVAADLSSSLSFYAFCVRDFVSVPIGQ